MSPLQIRYDESNDVLEINGIVYAGHLFRSMELCDCGTWLRIEERSAGGVVTVFKPSAELKYKFDLMAGKA